MAHAAGLQTGLIAAAMQGRVENIEQLLSGSDAGAILAADGERALHDAIRFGRTEAALLLLRHGVPADSATGDLGYNLLLAAGAGDLDVCRELISRNADMNAVRHNARSPLCAAAFHGELETVRLLLRYGARPNPDDPSGGNALVAAAAMGNPHVVAELLQAGASRDGVGGGGTTASQGCAAGMKRWPRRARLFDLVERMLREGPDSCSSELDAIPAASAWLPWRLIRRSKLASAVQQLDLPMVQSCLAEGRTNLVHPYEPEYALARAASKGCLPIMQALLDWGVDASGGESLHEPPLLAAASSGRYDAANLLLWAGADPNGRGVTPNNPLMAASVLWRKQERSDPRVALALIEFGAEVDAQIGTGRTALMDAAYSANTVVVSALLAAGADRDICDKRGRNALDCVARAQKRGHLPAGAHDEVLELLQPSRTAVR